LEEICLLEGPEDLRDEYNCFRSGDPDTGEEPKPDKLYSRDSLKAFLRISTDQGGLPVKRMAVTLGADVEAAKELQAFLEADTYEALEELTVHLVVGHESVLFPIVWEGVRRSMSVTRFYLRATCCDIPLSPTDNWNAPSWVRQQGSDGDDVHENSNLVAFHLTVRGYFSQNVWLPALCEFVMTVLPKATKLDKFQFERSIYGYAYIADDADEFVGEAAMEAIAAALEQLPMTSLVLRTYGFLHLMAPILTRIKHLELLPWPDNGVYYGGDGFSPDDYSVLAGNSTVEVIHLGELYRKDECVTLGRAIPTMTQLKELYIHDSFIEDEDAIYVLEGIKKANETFDRLALCEMSSDGI
jgi:hypothetical protein